MRLKFKWLAVVLGFISIAGYSQSKNTIVPKTYVAAKTSNPIVIDGDESDSSWNKVNWTDLFEDIENNIKPKYATKVKMLWDETNFYILAKIDEPHVWANLKQRDTIIFYNNDFEVFIDPDGDTFNYYELEINALNTAWDLFISKPYRENNVVLNDWNISGLKSAVKINGTINNPNDLDEGWILEMAIPWASYKTSYFDKNVPVDKFWRVNFSRVNWQHTVNNNSYERKKGADEKFLPEYNWVWSPMGVINMHEPEKWGYVYFSSKEGKDNFAIPQDEKVKWELYNLYRTQKQYYQKHKIWAKSMTDLTKATITVDNKILKPIIEIHASGYNISVKSPFSNQTFIIREDGKIIIKYTTMKLPKLLFFLLALSIFSCAKKEEQTTFKFGVWTTADAKKSDADYTKEFKKYKDGGIDEVLINTGTDPKLLKRIVPLAAKEGLKVHAWIMAMNRPGDSVALQHPDWYQVSKEGKSCFDNRPYVDYYQWLCPTRKESREHVLHLVEELAKVEGIESVHLDYIRFPDIFLPISLLPKYNLVQDVELPQFDFCYCDECIKAFEKIHHKNPKESHNTSIDMEWKNFRLNAIKAVVDDAYKIVHKHNKQLTAAVFPYPEMADHMVRQRWDKWNVDEVYPMIYHSFYDEEIDWVGYATKQGVADLEDKKTKINTGVYIPGLKNDKELKEAILLAKENGAVGVTFFDGNALSESNLKSIKETKASLK